VPDALQQRVPSVFITDTAVNPFQPDLEYRGFVASPTVGTPQGLAVYQNGVRVNEVFGDSVNWDFIPEHAVHRIDVVPNNPVFGLNALGGAVSVQMKNGFVYQGAEAELRGGSFGRRAVVVQAGAQHGPWSAYVAADTLTDRGWRDRSESRLRRVFADVGARSGDTELHVTYTGADNDFGAAAATPVEMLNRRWSSVYTTPQTYRNRLNFLNATITHDLGAGFAVSGNLYYRGLRQTHVDGNTSEVVPCDPATLPGLLCFEEDDDLLFSATGATVPAALLTGTPGSIDSTRTRADATGGTVQFTSTGDVFGRGNRLVVGASVDQGRVNFGATSELGNIGPDLFVTGTGVIIAQPDGEVAPVSVNTRNVYTGIYATNTFDLTPQLALTAGGRFNVVRIELRDQLGTALNGSHQFQRFNPVVGATYKLTPALTAYVGYSESNRVPTPSELACSDPERPCLLDNFLVSDPPLKQVVGRTWEAGLRGRPFGENFAFALGLFRTDTADDIMSVPAEVTGRGFFQNVGRSRRQGVEASAQARWNGWTVQTAYSFIDATFRDTFVLASPDNPLAVDGLITVTPGNRIPTIPQHRFKARLDYAVTDRWTVGTSLVAASGQYLRGDESNLNPMLPGYWVVNLDTTYQIDKRLSVFGTVRNLFDRRYYTFGTFFDPSEVPELGLTDPRTFSPGAPLAVYAGLRGKL
jgi:iron complex outermembrane receptor protein